MPEWFARLDRRKKYMAVAVTAVILIAVGITLGIVLTKDKGNDDTDSGTEPVTDSQKTNTTYGDENGNVKNLTDDNINGTQGDIDTDTVTTSRLTDILKSINSVSSKTALTDPATPTYRAYHWLSQDPTLVANAPDKQLVQRYILALLFYSTGGDGWSMCSYSEMEDTCEEGSEVVGRYLSPGHECEWFGNKCNDDKEIIELRIDNNNLVGSIPSEIGNLTSLEVFWAEDNSLIKSIPSEMAQLINLKTLQLRGNKLSGHIPEEIFDLNLTIFDVSSNHLSGTISKRWGELKGLTGFYVHDNDFNGSLPEELWDLTELTAVWFFNNNIDGVLSPKIGQLTKVREFLANDNNMSGHIPTEIGLMQSLEELYLFQNNFEGHLPDELYNVAGLKQLYLNDNNLSGTISGTIGQLIHLTHFVISKNSFDGSLPDNIQHCEALEKIWIQFNNITGVASWEICHLVNDHGTKDFTSDCVELYECDCCTTCCDSQANCVNNTEAIARRNRV